jgi:hypothetical protein
MWEIIEMVTELIPMVTDHPKGLTIHLEILHLIMVPIEVTVEIEVVILAAIEAVIPVAIEAMEIPAAVEAVVIAVVIHVDKKVL